MVVPPLGFAEGDDHELGRSHLHEPLQMGAKGAGAPDHDVARIDVGPPVGQERADGIGNAVDAVGNQRAEVLGIDLPVVFRGDTVDLRSPGGDVVRRAEARELAVTQTSHPP